MGKQQPGTQGKWGGQGAAQPTTKRDQFARSPPTTQKQKMARGDQWAANATSQNGTPRIRRRQRDNATTLPPSTTRKPPRRRPRLPSDQRCHNARGGGRQTNAARTAKAGLPDQRCHNATTPPPEPTGPERKTTQLAARTNRGGPPQPSAEGEREREFEGEREREFSAQCRFPFSLSLNVPKKQDF